jgi:hypothetical protein
MEIATEDSSSDKVWFLIFWWAAGLLFVFLRGLFRHYYQKAEIELTIEDVVAYFLISFGGAALWLIPIFYFFIDLAENYGRVKHTVIWKNKRAKNKEILFGDNDDDSTKTDPKF